MATENEDPLTNSCGGYEELVSLLPHSPTPQAVYRCPVSTPSNVNRSDELTKRKKGSRGATLLDTKSFIVRTSGLGRRRSRESRGSAQRNVEYYFVDRAARSDEEAMTNSFWLKSLCAQPVEEILGKYRRKSDFRRTKLLWSKTFSTPGEQAILSAWATNTTLALQKPLIQSRKILFKGLSLSQEVKVSSAPAERPNHDVTQGNKLPSPTATSQKVSDKGERVKEKTASRDKNQCPPIKRPVFSFCCNKTRKGYRTVKKHLSDSGPLSVQHDTEILGLMPTPAPPPPPIKVSQGGVKLPVIGRKDVSKK